jgi:RsiW-degrading membrane proteinase PrsW (M82 family)
VQDRVALGLLVPMAAAVVTILLIVSIGTLLLAVAEGYGEPIAVAVALALGGVVLVGCALASHRRGSQQASTH